MRRAVAALVFVAVLATSTPAIAGITVGTGAEDGLHFSQCGYATYYAEDVMERVAHDLKRAPCPYCVGIIATTEWRYLGRDIWVWYPGVGGVVGPFRVVDVGGGTHLASLRARARVFEFSWWWGQAVGMRRPTWACFATGGA